MFLDCDLDKETKKKDCGGGFSPRTAQGNYEKKYLGKTAKKRGRMEGTANFWTLSIIKIDRTRKEGGKKEASKRGSNSRPRNRSNLKKE